MEPAPLPRPAHRPAHPQSVPPSPLPRTAPAPANLVGTRVALYPYSQASTTACIGMGAVALTWGAGCPPCVGIKDVAPMQQHCIGATSYVGLCLEKYSSFFKKKLSLAELSWKQHSTIFPQRTSKKHFAKSMSKYNNTNWCPGTLYCCAQFGLGRLTRCALFLHGENKSYRQVIKMFSMIQNWQQSCSHERSPHVDNKHGVMITGAPISTNS